MPDFSAPATANYNAPSFTSTLAGLQGIQSNALQIQQQKQTLQIGQNESQAAQQTQDERQRVTQMMQSGQDDQGNSIRGADGQPDPSKILPALGRMAPLTGQQYAQNILKTLDARVQLQTAATVLSGQQRQALMGPIQAIATNPNDPDIIKNSSAALDSWAQEHPEMGGIVNSAKTMLSHLENEPDPAKRSQMANSFSALLQPGQKVETQPQAASVNNGAASLSGTTAPPNAGGGFTPSTSVTQQLPPTTPTTLPDGTQGAIGAPQAHFEGLQGPGRAAALAAIASGNEDPRNRQEAANVMAGRPQGFLPQSLPAGQAQNISNNVDEMNRHFASLQDSSSGLQLASSLTGNIKALSHQAITGTDADKLAYVNGLLAHLPGFTGKPETELKTATDLLEKNMAQLNLSTPASSDAARAMVSIARPHNSMTPDAADEASDQLVGQIKANMAMRNALQGYKMRGDVQGYQGFRSELEQTADPRIWQMEGKSPQEQQKFMQALTPKDRDSLVQKAQQLKQMGMIQ